MVGTCERMGENKLQRTAWDRKEKDLEEEGKIKNEETWRQDVNRKERMRKIKCAKSNRDGGLCQTNHRSRNINWWQLTLQLLTN